MSLKLYSALIRRDTNQKIADIALVMEGFSFLALFFSLPWFLCHKMWQSSFALIFFEAILVWSYGGNLLSGFDIFFLQVAIFFVVAINANHWYRQYLRSKGYFLTAFVLAQNEEEARLKAMKSLHRNSPDLSFDEISDEIIDPKSYLRAMKINKEQKFSA